MGTTAYTPPEEILAQPRDHRVDVYSLGCVLFEMLVGEPPFVRDQELDVMYAHIGDPRPRVSDRRPGLPPGSTRSSRRRWRYLPTTAIRAARSSSPRQVRCCPRGGSGRPRRLSPAEHGGAPRRRSRRRRAAPTSGSRTVLTGRSPWTVVPLEPMRLVVRAGPATGRELLVADELLLGRVTTLDGALADDREMSRRHARVHRDAEGGLFVEDQQSANGTFVNGVRIEGPQPLRAGDELRIGSTVFEVAISEQQPTTEPEQPAASESASAVVQDRRPGAATSDSWWSRVVGAAEKGRHALGARPRSRRAIGGHRAWPDRADRPRRRWLAGGESHDRTARDGRAPAKTSRPVWIARFWKWTERG